MKKTKNLLVMCAMFTATSFFAQVKIGENPTTVDNSAVLELESTTQGMLTPRMTNAQRDAIASPANGLIIFNTSSNSIEFYKSSCTCWAKVTDSDISTTPVLNTAPYAWSLNYTGNFYAGQTVTINYIYADGQNDPEGATSFQWQQANNSSGIGATFISGANSATYNIPSSVGTDLWIRAVVTPRSTSGVLNGIITTSGFVKVDPTSIPSATSVLLSGTPTQGSALTGNYTFTGGNGVESTNPLQPTLFDWQYASDVNGLNIGNASLYSLPAFTSSYTPQSDLIGKFIRFGVRARDSNGAQASNFVYSSWVGPVAVASEQAPVVSNLSYNPTPAQGILINSSYTYFDANADPEGASVFQWYRADDVNGTNEIAISGATGLTYTPVLVDVSKHLGFGVTPIALSGTSPGSESKYYHPESTRPRATFTFTGSNIKYSPLFNQGRVMNASNNILVEVDVTVAGSAIFSTPTVNGYSFTLSSTFTTTGVQWVSLSAIGTLTTYSITGDNFIITGEGFNIVTKSITIKNTLTGGIATLSNGTQSFSANSSCTNALISAGYNSTTCSGSVTVGSNSYGMVNINGQCWMTRNLEELPASPCTNPINTGCNVWLNTGLGDLGTWGYYNSTATNGTAGWSLTPPISNAGLLYQWSAAMNGSTDERAKGVCPTGWHIPSDCEWMYLEHGLGMSITDQQANGARSSGNVGNQLRSAGTGATNTSGFSGLLTGTRNFSNGVFAGLNSTAEIWTSSGGTSTIAGRRQLNSNQVNVGRGSFSKGLGLSVRCIRD